VALLDATLNIGMDAIAASITHIGIATADPGTTGTNASAAPRVAAGWPAAANGDVVVTNKAFTGGAANGAIWGFTFWSAASGGTFRGSQILAAGSDASFNAAGNYTANSIAINSAAT